MSNDMKLYLPTNFGDKNNSGDSMRSALSLIAKEIQRFRFESEAGKHTIYKNDEDVDTLVKKKPTATLDTKNKQQKKLKEHLKTVYNVAKIVLSAKNRETDLLMNRLNEIRNESSDLWKKNAENLSLIQQLRMENYNINNEVQFLCNFIHMAYKKLQKMRNETPKDMPFIEELKAILLACGQYYADYCNTRDRCSQLERRNRFLKNKLNIVENNLAATTEELRSLRSLNRKLRIKCGLNHKTEEAFSKHLKKPNASEIFLDELLCNEIKSPNRYNAIPTTFECERNLNIPNKSLCITSHLDTVRNLLLDQDNMLKELKELYLEVGTPES